MATNAAMIAAATAAPPPPAAAPRSSSSASSSTTGRGASTTRRKSSTTSHRFSPLTSSSSRPPGASSGTTTSSIQLITNTIASSHPASTTSSKKHKMMGTPASASTADTTAALYVAESAAHALTAAFQQMETARSSAGSNSTGGGGRGGKVPRRRNRAVLSCLKCHQRRVKCDRKQPCTACIRYGAPEECKVPDNAKAQQQRNRINSTSTSASANPAGGDDETIAALVMSSMHGHDDAHMDGNAHHLPGESGDEDELMDDDPDNLGPRPHGLSAPAPRSRSMTQDHSAQSHTSSPSAPAGLAHGLPATASPIWTYSTGRGPVSSSNSPLVSRSRFPSINSSQASGAAAESASTSSPLKRSYLSHRSADVLTRFISEYEGQITSASGGKPERAPRSYSQEHIDEIWSFCENLPSRNLDILIGSYLNDVDWMYQIVDADSVSYRLLPDLISRILDPHLSWSARPQEWTNALRWGDMTRLSLLGGMILGSVQATGETVLKLTFKQAAGASPVGGSSALVLANNGGGPAGNNNNHTSSNSFRNGGAPGLTDAAVAAAAAAAPSGPGGDVILSSGQSARSGSSGGQDSRSSAGGPPASNRSANSVKTEVLSVLELQVRRLIHLATAVEGPTHELVKARLVMLNFIKNEARLAEPEAHEFLHETVDITMKAGMHKDPGPLNISEDEKEDRRRLFYNIYAFDRFSALFFGKLPCFPEEEITTNLPQERWLINGKEHLFSFLLLKGRLAKIVTHIASAALEVPVDGDKVSELEVELQDFSKMTQGTPFHPSLPQIPPELSRFHTLDRQRHLYLICFHSVREALHRLAFFQGPMISAQHAQYSREACAQSAVVLLETQRSLRLRIFSTGDLCCFYIPFFNLEPAITLIISAIVVLQAEPAQREADYIRTLPIKKAKVDYYMQWAQHALDLLRSMPDDIAVATQGSFLLSRVLRKAAIIVEHSTRPLLPGGAGFGFGGGNNGGAAEGGAAVTAAGRRALASGAAAAMASLERTSAWMQDLFCDENGQRMKMPYLTAPPRPPPFTRTASRPETFLELQRASDPSGNNTGGASGHGGTELQSSGAGASTGFDQDTMSASSATNLTSSLLGVGAGTMMSATTASSFPVSELVAHSVDSMAAQANNKEGGGGARQLPQQERQHLQNTTQSPPPSPLPPPSSNGAGMAAIAARSNSLGTTYSSSSTISNPAVVSTAPASLPITTCSASVSSSSGPALASVVTSESGMTSAAAAAAATAAGPMFNAADGSQDAFSAHSYRSGPPREQAMMSLPTTGFPPGFVFDFSNGSHGGAGGVMGIPAVGGPSLADLGLGFFDTLFDSRNSFVPLGGATASMAPADAGMLAASAATTTTNHNHTNTNDLGHNHNHILDLGHGQNHGQGQLHHPGHGHQLGHQQHHHHVNNHNMMNTLPSSSSDPNNSTIGAGLVAPSSGGSGEINNGFGHEFHNNNNISGGVHDNGGGGANNGSGSGGFMPSVGPGPEASLASMGLEAYMNAWLLSIQNNPTA
ncbi:hypothetical protein V8E36_003555 [Tilletia maclaganii]